MIYDQANTPSLSQWLGASLYLLAHLPHWVALFHASGGSNLRSSGSIYPQYSFSESTRKRRASTVSSWIKEIFNMANDF